MSLAVVRCPGCRGASRVSADALGQMVGCPRCQMPFVAEEEVPVVAPVARPAPRKLVATVAPSRPRPIKAEPPESADAIPDPEHDPHDRPVAGLPVSVLAGLALVPFGIPLLWRVAPLVTGLEATLSLAVPVALAVAASALCLGVVYTIDWTATTRVKGVLMLVGLSYLSAAGLYFLKKDLMDGIRDWADSSRRWSVVSLNDGSQVQMPGRATADDVKPLGEFASIGDARRSVFLPDPPSGPRYEYRFAVGQPSGPRKTADDAWFASVGDKLRVDNGGQLVGGAYRPIDFPKGVCREWTFDVGNRVIRVIRVYAVADRVYYLHAEGPGLTADDDHARQFFGNFSASAKELPAVKP